MKSKPVCTDENMNVAPEVMFGELPVSVCRQDPGIEGCGSVMHRHDEAQLTLVTEGSVRLTLGDRDHILQKGDAVFINCQRLHSSHPASAGNCAYICVKLNPAAVSGSANYGLGEKYVTPVTRASSPDIIFPKGENAEKLRSLILELCEVYEKREDIFEIRLNILLQEIWIIVYGSMDRDAGNVRSTSYSEKLRIELLCDFIHRNYAEKISLNDIANAAHISEGECCRIFKRVFHTSPFQYLVYYRLSQSITLLRETDYSISEIAQHVGFCSSSYYTKCFRKEYNCVPHKYRQDMHRCENEMTGK